MRKQSLTMTVLLAATIGSTQAGVVTYTNLGSWSTAGPVDGTISFSGLTSGGSYSSPLTMTPLIFTALVGTSLGVLNTFGPGTGNFIYTLGSLKITPQGGTNVFGLGFNLGCYACSGTQTPSVTILDVNNNTFNYSAMTTPGFWGFRSDIGIASVSVSYGGDYVSVDDVTYGQTSGGTGSGGADTPEIGTIIMMATGLALFARYRKFAIATLSPL